MSEWWDVGITGYRNGGIAGCRNGGMAVAAHFHLHTTSTIMLHSLYFMFYVETLCLCILVFYQQHIFFSSFIVNLRKK